jgi:hypothetical protein
MNDDKLPDEAQLDLQVIMKQACMLVVTCHKQLDSHQMASVRAALEMFRLQNPGLPPIMLLPHDMTVEALMEEHNANSVQP